MKLRKHLHWLLYLLFALSCARQTSPTGGPKDSIPPSFVSSVPKSQQTNFKGSKVELTFDEALQLNNAREQIIITPDVGKDFEATVKKNKVIITFKNPLSDTTTYSLNFREAIQDITEKNPASNLKLAFSTGSYIDSLSITGTVYDMLTSKPIKEGTVALYKQDTFNIFKHKATVFTKTDDKGVYLLGNLKPGAYKLYALQDNNKNLIIDSRSEPYGYATQAITLKENQKGLRVPLVKLDARPLKLTSARPVQTYFNLKTSKNLYTYQITTPPGQPLLSSFGADQENVRIYNTAEVKDSLLIKFTAQDSLLNKIDTSLYVKFSTREIKPELFSTSPSDFLVSVSRGMFTGSFTFNKPVAVVNFDSLYYRIDSINTIHFTDADIQVDSMHNIIRLRKAIPKNLITPKVIDPDAKPLTTKPPVAKPNPAIQPTQKSKEKNKKSTRPAILDNQIYAGYGAFVSAESDSSKLFTQVIKPVTLETTGMFHVTIKTKEPHYVVDLISKNKIVASQKDKPNVTFEDLIPGDYQIRLTIDTNNDGKWSPGNYFTLEQPEPIVFYMNEKKLDVVNIKANFEIGPLVITY